MWKITKNNQIFTIITSLLLMGFNPLTQAQSNLFTGTQNRVVVLARFNGDPEIDTPREHFEEMFNGEANSLKSYFKAISNDRLTVNSLMYPSQSSTDQSYELKYCYYCYDNTWKGSYSNCKGTDITSLFDINIGFIIKELATQLEASGELPEASQLDADNDGYVDNFVIVFRGAARGEGKGVYSPQTGNISSTFTDTNGSIQIKGKTIGSYTIAFERNSLDTHGRLMLKYMGFPVQYRNMGTLPRSVGPWDPMDGPLLSYPLVYNRVKYTNGNWIPDIPKITEPGEYTLSSADHAENNAYKLSSSDPKQFWILEYRDKTATWDKALTESGLIIYRINTNYTGSVTANPEAYLYRKDGTSTVAGDILNAPFSDYNGRTSFNANSNPKPFLSDGTVFQEIDISNIRFQGDQMHFQINSVYTDIKTLHNNDWKISVNPESHTIQWNGEGMEELSVFDLSGRLQGKFSMKNTNQLELPNWQGGIYTGKIKGNSGELTLKFILK